MKTNGADTSWVYFQEEHVYLVGEDVFPMINSNEGKK